MMRTAICAECGKVIENMRSVPDVCFCANCPHPVHDGTYYRDGNGKLCYTPKAESEGI